MGHTYFLVISVLIQPFFMPIRSFLLSLCFPHLFLSLALGLCCIEAGGEVQALLLQLLALLLALLSNCKTSSTKHYSTTVTLMIVGESDVSQISLKKPFGGYYQG